ncbi:hypothetical protein AVEN_13821-1 [Araneus ventricosus]|uniref:Uncharacterized protein n=1 Tax=Araneus ventricosus TaxID=182803 RepID=A0A4Y2U8N3_ARAVE|nr:hypothetical protein AVEN_13821-1 [Araneus ventricosus]
MNCLRVLLLMMIPEDQQSYIRSMSLCTLKKSKVNRGLGTRSCWESPRNARILSGVACSAVHFGQILHLELSEKHLELSEKIKLLTCSLRKRVSVVWSCLLQSIDCVFSP